MYTIVRKLIGDDDINKYKIREFYVIIQFRATNTRYFYNFYFYFELF